MLSAPSPSGMAPLHSTFTGPFHPGRHCAKTMAAMIEGLSGDEGISSVMRPPLTCVRWNEMKWS